MSAGNVPTEVPNPRSEAIDRLDTRGIVDLIHAEDRTVAKAVGEALAAVARAADIVASRLAAGGRLLYVGAGTSGRLGVLDASEMPPTYGVSPALVQGIIAGGPDALVRAQEGAEDHADSGRAAIAGRYVGPGDVVMGLSASGGAAFVLAAMEEARTRGAATLCCTANPNSRLARTVDVPVVVDTGPEVITGSTRMKAGTATKMVLNMITTAAMVKLGRVQGNRMTCLKPTCDKLRRRARRLVREATGANDSAVRSALERTSGDVREAIRLLRRKTA